MDADVLAGLVAPALFVAAGAGLQALLPRPLEREASARAGYAYLLGLAWCTLSVWVASAIAGVPVAAGSFLAAGAVAIAAGAVAVVRRRGDLGGWRRSAAPPRRHRWAPAVGAGVIAAASIALVADAMVHPVADFDGRMVWGTLAKYVAAERTVLPGAVTDPAGYLIHPRYPLLMPLAQVAAAGLGRQTLESRAVRPLYALLLPALVFAVRPALARAGGRRGGALAAVLVFAAPVVLWKLDVGPRGTFSDFPLAAFLGAGLAVLTHPAARREGWRGWVAGLFLAAAVGTKNEGLVLAPLAVAAVAVGAGWRSRRAALGRAAIAVALAALFVVVWRAQIPNRNDEAYFEDFSPQALLTGLPERAGEILRSTASLSLDVTSWGLLFWLLPLLALTGRRGLRSRATRASLVCLAGECALAGAAYAVVGDFSIVAVTWNRFLVQMAVPLALLVAATGRATLRGARFAHAADPKASPSGLPPSDLVGSRPASRRGGR